MILGICGSPRKANSELLLDKALESARKISGLKTEKVRLKDKNINYCLGCFKCMDLVDNGYGCQVHRDEMDEIFYQLEKCRGLILATPVYFGGMTAQLKTFMDRTEPLLRYAKGRWRYTLRNKVGGAIAVGGNRNGGQESTLIAIHHFFFIHDMIVVGVGPDEQPGCYLGGSAYSGSDAEKGSKIKDAVRTDDLGIKSSEVLGRRVAEVIMKYG
jgi:multimeric flavodoxin WrbA